MLTSVQVTLSRTQFNEVFMQGGLGSVMYQAPDLEVGICIKRGATPCASLEVDFDVRYESLPGHHWELDSFRFMEGENVLFECNEVMANIYGIRLEIDSDMEGRDSDGFWERLMQFNSVQVVFTQLNLFGFTELEVSNA